MRKHEPRATAGAKSLTSAATRNATSNDGGCFRAAIGAEVPEPEDLRSVDGILKVDLAFRSFVDSKGEVRYCYVTLNGKQSPDAPREAGRYGHTKFQERGDGDTATESNGGGERTIGRCDVHARAEQAPPTQNTTKNSSGATADERRKPEPMKMRRRTEPRLA